jgi:hypothetical protein
VSPRRFRLDGASVFSQFGAPAVQGGHPIVGHSVTHGRIEVIIRDDGGILDMTVVAVSVKSARRIDFAVARIVQQNAGLVDGFVFTTSVGFVREARDDLKTITAVKVNYDVWFDLLFAAGQVHFVTDIVLNCRNVKLWLRRPNFSYK